MRVLLCHRFFWPDTPPYAVILNEMAKLLRAQGYEVDILTSLPSYKSVDANKKMPFKQLSRDGFNVYRLPVFNESRGGFFKLLNYLFFPLLAFFFLLFKRQYDVVTVSSSPPVILAFFVALAVKLKGGRLIYHCMDLHPEIGRISGEFRNALVYRFLLSLERFTCSVAKNIIVLSEDMKQSMVARSELLAKKIVVINNFSLPSYGHEQLLKESFKKSHGVKRIIFAGNIGRFQGLDLLVAAMQSFNQAEQIELLFLGEGVFLPKLKQLAQGISNIRFIPHQSVSVAKQLIRDSDFGVVSLQNDVIRFAYPSKTMVYLECGTPILLCANKGSELAGFVEMNRIGYFSPANDVNRLQKVFKLIIDEDERVMDSEMIIGFYQQYFGRQEFDKRFLQLINS